jgi:hypothetical protein
MTCFFRYSRRYSRTFSEVLEHDLRLPSEQE